MLRPSSKLQGCPIISRLRETTVNLKIVKGPIPYLMSLSISKLATNIDYLNSYSHIFNKSYSYSHTSISWSGSINISISYNDIQIGFEECYGWRKN
jgi:hypothetical protein